ncbi:MAG: carboxymuconolactone decarboxylase family protein, partial [Halobacteriales archaeon]|nr:carboxymuconolactone decarboxylase family protein [Halobacteriales archaeon]
RTKEMIALGVSMVNGCEYCIRAHSAVLRNMFEFSDSDLVELAGVVAHVSAINRFETATVGDSQDPLFELESAADVPLLAEIEEELGSLPAHYRIMARDETYLEYVWSRHRSMFEGGNLDRTEKELVAFGVSIANIAPTSTRVHRATLRHQGVTDDELFEALRVIENFQKHNRFTTGLLLHPDVDLGTT